MSSAEEIAGLHLAAHRYQIVRCSCGWEVNRSDPKRKPRELHDDHVLAVLAEEGWAVVKLAECCPDHNTDYYRAPEGWMVETPDYVPGCVAVEGEVMAPADARNLAAALLAAAHSAEHSTPAD